VSRNTLIFVSFLTSIFPDPTLLPKVLRFFPTRFQKRSEFENVWNRKQKNQSETYDSVQRKSSRISPSTSKVQC